MRTDPTTGNGSKRGLTPRGRRSTPAPTNPDHHIWCNNGTWFLHLTVLWQGHRHRLRTSLKTRDVAVARLRRDRFLERLAEEPQVRLACRHPRRGPIQ